MEAVYGFLGVDAGVADGIEAEAHNPFAQPRNRLTALAVSSPRSRALARALLPEAARARVERYALVRGQKPELDADLRRLLEALFEAERPALESLLGRRLPW